MGRLLDYLILTINILSNVIYVHCGPGPGTIYYRKPTKLVFYKKHPPVLIYPKKSDDEYPLQSNLKSPMSLKESINFEHNSDDLDLEQDHVAHAANTYYSATNGLPDNQHVKYGKYFLLNPNFLEHLMQYDEKYYIRQVEKKPEYDNWLAWLFGIKSTKHKEYKEKTPHNHNFDLGPATSYAHFADTKFHNVHNEPIYNYHPKKQLNIVPPQFQHFEHVDDVKPVVEHIEDDIKYDFRTKTHSYDR